MSTYTEDHLVEQPAIQLMQHELGWDGMWCIATTSGPYFVPLSGTTKAKKAMVV
jgi:hypothetical protein